MTLAPGDPINCHETKHQGVVRKSCCIKFPRSVRALLELTVF